MTLLRSFWTEEDGAVTVDWVVLAGAVVAMALVIMVIIRPGVNSGSEKISTAIATAVSSTLD
ncbi:hypothetical protein [Roseobacter sp. HKCCA0434]|uniref:hypothetical protein n=1 Tax=Roseobacter sp. HKCCA0434 TaxID=3079297 RepID=UPI002905E0F8|nr:hypothetical protein [Roseobacter sp. HKCCA0434]